MVDIVAALAELLKADADIAGLVADRAHGGELPASAAKHMPRSALVVQPSGGTPYAPAGTVGLEAQRLDIISYGATPLEAALLRGTVFHRLRAVQRRVVGNVLIHWVQPAGGYTAGRDRDGAWPYAFQSFQALFATDEVT